MLFELFVFGGFWFWILVSVIAAWLFAAVKHENGGWATGSVITFAMVMWLFGNFNVFNYIFKNPTFVLCCFLGYLMVGVLWSFCKWMFFNRTIRETYDRIKESFLNDNRLGGTIIPEGLKSAWRTHVSKSSEWEKCSYTFKPHFYSGIQRAEDMRPKAKDHKSDITFWISFWPVSMIWSIVHDFVERMINEIFNYFKSVYDNISRRMFRGIDADFD